MPDVEEMRELLAYANFAKVAQALRVSRTAVSRWAKGNDVTPYRVRQVRDLLRPPTAREPAPQWVERVLTSLMLQEERVGATDVELARAEAKAIAYLAVTGQGRPRREDGGAGGAADA